MKMFSRGNSNESISFVDLGLEENICRALGDEGYTTPTEIQNSSIPPLLEGRDLLGCAQTGTGKTASFALPTLQRLAGRRRTRRGVGALVLTPTRELASQVAASFKTYGRHLNLKTTVMYGGVKDLPQRKAMDKGTDVLVATPGRLLDLHGRGFIDFSTLSVLIFDEGDRMLDMGFLPDLKRIVGLLPKERQSALFSATMPADIKKLALKMLNEPVNVNAAPVSSASESVEQSVCFVDRGNKRKLLLHVLGQVEVQRTLVFAGTKAVANRLSGYLTDNGVRAEAIHGNKSQAARQKALLNFRKGSTKVLVASDLAARGLDVDGISHVVNYDLPDVAETYVHRIGRTGRADATGVAISFCDASQRSQLRNIERLLSRRVPERKDHPFPATEAEKAPEPRGPRGRGRSSGGPVQKRVRGRAGGPPRSGGGNRQGGRPGNGPRDRRGPSNAPRGRQTAKPQGVR